MVNVNMVVNVPEMKLSVQDMVRLSGKCRHGGECRQVADVYKTW